MTDPRLVDHVTGLEQQLIELVDEQRWATEQDRGEDARRLEAQIAGVRDELASTAERIAADSPQAPG